jgi:hypothetical protein
LRTSTGVPSQRRRYESKGRFRKALDDLVILGKAADLALRKDDLAVDDDVELASPARCDRRVDLKLVG